MIHRAFTIMCYSLHPALYVIQNIPWFSMTHSLKSQILLILIFQPHSIQEWFPIPFPKSTLFSCQSDLHIPPNQAALHSLVSVHFPTLFISAFLYLLRSFLNSPDHLRRMLSLPLSNSLSSCFSTTHSEFTKYHLGLTLVFFSDDCVLPPLMN